MNIESFSLLRATGGISKSPARTFLVSVIVRRSCTPSCRFTFSPDINPSVETTGWVRSWTVNFLWHFETVLEGIISEGQVQPSDIELGSCSILRTFWSLFLWWEASTWLWGAHTLSIYNSRTIYSMAEYETQTRTCAFTCSTDIFDTFDITKHFSACWKCRNIFPALMNRVNDWKKRRGLGRCLSM